MSITEISTAIKEKALELGFADCGFSKAESLPEEAARLQEWLDGGYHARMGYMANHFEKRTDPTLLVEGARSVISLLYNYYTDKKQTDPEAPVISKYAYGRDYHLVLKEKMNRLFYFIRSLHPEAEGRVFVDSAPVLDRSWARKAGLGWIGKNSCLISRKAGSFVFIGEIILNLELDYNQVPEGDFCGSCRRCVEACPTGAILENRTLDSERCISYQTIENKGEISPELESLLAGRVFGCDICQDVCPWNRKAILHAEPEFEPSSDVLNMTADQWSHLDQERYKELFIDSPVERAGFSKLLNNLAFLQKKA
ncbi:MAG: tRNA epoxyqueuosine(34) reductase QueG [Bacteroidia bacterium]|nr:MAG: tRNA epoxyqueuosine(34) reductase QueG [Bacteroidia bacterium]